MEIRTSYQVDADFLFYCGHSPFPLFFGKQDQLLKSDLIDTDKQKLKNFINGSSIRECYPDTSKGDIIEILRKCYK
jgi:hypothetical protein